MVQQLRLTMQRAVEAVSGVGTVGVFFVFGRVQGTANVSRAVGKLSPGKMLDWAEGGECGKFSSFTVTAQGNACSAEAGGVVANRAVLQQVGVSASAGQVLVTDEANFMLADLKTT